MATKQLGAFLRRLGRRAGAPPAGALSDAQLLEQFVTGGDEAAFEVLVWRHGSLVLGVCRRLLRHEQDAEDAFQATFLTLVRRAAAIRRHEALSAWLYKVAYRVALRLRAQSARHAEHRPLTEEPSTTDRVVLQHDLQSALAEEIDRLPRLYRTVFILCCMEGRTHEEAARQLGCPAGTVASRLSGARQRLRCRLIRRGLAPAIVLAGALPANAAPAVVPAALLETTIETALRLAMNPALASTTPAILAEGVLRAMFLTKMKFIAALVLTCMLLGAGAVGLGRHALANREDAPSAEVVPGEAAALRLSPRTVDKWDIQTRKARPRPAAPPTLRLRGALELDPNRVARVRSRFAGEVARLGDGEEKGKRRPLRYGDRVKKNQLLAVIESKDLSEKKSELVDSLVRLWCDEPLLEGLEKLLEKGQISPATVRTQRTAVATDNNSVGRVELTLRTWHVPPEDIQAVKDEAKRVFERKGKRDLQKESQWAKVEVRAPLDGVIVEKNVALGNIVDPTLDLFKIADLDRLLAVVLVHEDDLAALRALPADKRHWSLRVLAEPDAPPLAGTFRTISPLVDSSRHTTSVSGQVDNPKGELRPGQAIEATVVLPAAPARELIVPASALIEEDGVFFLFVQPDPAQPVYCQRRVAVVRRAGDVAHVRAGPRAIRPGERVVTTGAAELRAALVDQRVPPDAEAQ